ncbi:hypothetical protein [Ideonella livida]|uniref:Uncharacterized protein n=1 Tax=Ideonella livida TaxID=2707176 RepID=A0A7C9TKT5_9BURK|nr:hypothetical protein [Ideonella livida]NDY92941.1 hypothetical protein [Ideonella livida]
MPDATDMPAGQGLSSWYLLDADDRLLDVSPDWDAAAMAAGGKPLLRAAVVGQPLRRFVSGDATRLFLEALLTAARLTGQPRSRPYRCDAPDRVRELRMTVEPLPGGVVRVRHELLASRQRPALPQVITRAATGRWWRCSQCLSLWPRQGQVGGLPPAAADRQARWLPAPAIWSGATTPGTRLVADAVCPACRRMAPGSADLAPQAENLNPVD